MPQQGLQSGVLEFLGAGTSLLAGYIFIHLSPYRRFSASSLRIDRFALHVLGYSLVLYVAGALFAELLKMLPAWWLGGNALFLEFRDAFTSNKIPIPIFYALLLSPIIAGLDRLWQRLWMSSDPALQLTENRSWYFRIRAAEMARYVRKSNDATLRVLYRAIFLQKLMMLTLKSGKVYVGDSVLPQLDPTALGSSIRLIPFVSGYRNTDTKKVCFTTLYDDLSDHLTYLRDPTEPRDQESPLISEPATLKSGIGKPETPIDAEDVGIIIMWSEVESLTLYDAGIYQFFQAQIPVPSSDAAKEANAVRT